MAEWLPDSSYGYSFYAYSGDAYGGTVHQDTGSYWVGQQIYTPYGYYQIQSDYQYFVDTSYIGVHEGTTYTDWYWDGIQGGLGTYAYPITGSPSGWGGLGSEYDSAWNGVYWDDFGVGGAVQAGYFG